MDQFTKSKMCQTAQDLFFREMLETIPRLEEIMNIVSPKLLFIAWEMFYLDLNDQPCMNNTCVLDYV